MTDTYFDIFGQKSNAIFQQNNYSANTFHVFDFLMPTSHTQSVKNPSILQPVSLTGLVNKEGT